MEVLSRTFQNLQTLLLKIFLFYLEWIFNGKISLIVLTFIPGSQKRDLLTEAKNASKNIWKHLMQLNYWPPCPLSCVDNIIAEYRREPHSLLTLHFPYSIICIIRNWSMEDLLYLYAFTAISEIWLYSYFIICIMAILTKDSTNWNRFVRKAGTQSTFP